MSELKCLIFRGLHVSTLHFCFSFRSHSSSQIETAIANDIVVVFVLIDVVVPHSPYHKPLVIFFCPVKISSWGVYTRIHKHSVLPAVYFRSVFPLTHTHTHNFTRTHKEHCLLSVTDPPWALQTSRRQLSWRQLRELWQPESTTLQERSRPGAALRARPLTSSAPLVSIQPISQTTHLYNCYTAELQSDHTYICSPSTRHPPFYRLIDSLPVEYTPSPCYMLVNDCYRLDYYQYITILLPIFYQYFTILLTTYKTRAVASVHMITCTYWSCLHI